MDALEEFVFFTVESSPHLYLEALLFTGDLYLAAELSVLLIVTDSELTFSKVNGFLIGCSGARCLPILYKAY